MKIWIRVLRWFNKRVLKELSPLEHKMLDQLLQTVQEPRRESLKRQVAAIQGVRHVVDVDGEVEEVFFWFDTPDLEQDSLRITSQPGDLILAEFDIHWNTLPFRAEIHVVNGFMYGIEYRPAPPPMAMPGQAAVTLRALNPLP